MSNHNPFSEIIRKSKKSLAYRNYAKKIYPSVEVEDEVDQGPFDIRCAEMDFSIEHAPPTYELSR